MDNFFSFFYICCKGNLGVSENGWANRDVVWDAPMLSWACPRNHLLDGAAHWRKLAYTIEPSMWRRCGLFAYRWLRVMQRSSRRFCGTRSLYSSTSRPTTHISRACSTASWNDLGGRATGNLTGLMFPLWVSRLTRCFHTTFCRRFISFPPMDYLHFAWGVAATKSEMHIGHARMFVCVSVCPSVATFPHYCRNLDVVVHYWADLQSVQGFGCYDNKPNAKCQRVLVFTLCLVELVVRWTV